MKTLAELTAILGEFRDAREWCRFHTPAELARALMVEAAELNRLFLWKSEPDRQKVANEIADVMIYALYLADCYGLAPEEIIEDKIAINDMKYALDKDHAKRHGWRK